MLWDIIEEKLVDAGLGIPGTNMFREHMPASIRTGILLRTPASGIAVDDYIPNLYKTTFQVIVRDVERESGNQRAFEVINALKTEGEQFFPASAERNDARILRLVPDRLPISFPRLDGNGFEWSLNFTFIFSCEIL